MENRVMQAIETEYMGYLFRSRNEARWAALFQGLGWNWNYEPFDADGYIPDFVISGARPILVEVKPDVEIASLARHADRVTRAVVDVWPHDVLIVGSIARPFCTDEVHGREQLPAVGWLLEYDERGDWTPGIGHWGRCPECHGEIRLSHDTAWFAARPCGHYQGGLDPLNEARYPTSSLEAYWSAASNDVRWLPPARRPPRYAVARWG
jgi:hypothetical protein